jgi:hypothetical protein
LREVLIRIEQTTRQSGTTNERVVVVRCQSLSTETRTARQRALTRDDLRPHSRLTTLSRTSLQGQLRRIPRPGRSVRLVCCNPSHLVAGRAQIAVDMARVLLQQLLKPDPVRAGPPRGARGSTRIRLCRDPRDAPGRRTSRGE